ncbi:MAG: phosphoheptose isomerase [Acidimicrobiales bacterium]|nr:MAG: phosphoheptose isomerase [Acidimicrobiales bacterium]
MSSLSRCLLQLEADLGQIEGWGVHLADVLMGGGRLLALGNGGSAALAQHLTSELVGRYLDERMPLSAISLHADSSTTTAIVNDYGPTEVFARQVRAHGRPGDVLLALSTSGRSPNLMTAVDAARDAGLLTWALTGAAPSPLSRACHDSLAVEAPATATVQEVHQVVVHLLCAAVDAVVLTAAVIPGR